MVNKINQKIDGSDNYQQNITTQNNIIINKTGITKKEVKKISSQLAKKTAEEYFQQSLVIVKRRIDEFENIVIEKLNNINNGLNCFNDPDFLWSYRKSQIEAAKTDDESSYQMLSELLVHRQNNAGNKIKKTGVDGAIEIVNNLSDTTLSALTIATCIIIGISPVSNNLEEGLEVLNNCYETILKNGLPNSNEWLDQLDVLKAIRLGVGGLTTFNKFDTIISNTFNGYSIAGIKKGSDEHKKALDIQQQCGLNILNYHPLNNDYLIVPVTSMNNIKQLHKITTNRNNIPINDNEISSIEKIIELYTKNKDELEEAKKKFMEAVDRHTSLKKIHEWWDNIPNYFELTIIGKVLGHANAKKCYSRFPDID